MADSKKATPKAAPKAQTLPTPNEIADGVQALLALLEIAAPERMRPVHERIMFARDCVRSAQKHVKIALADIAAKKAASAKAAE